MDMNLPPMHVARYCITNHTQLALANLLGGCISLSSLAAAHMLPYRPHQAQTTDWAVSRRVATARSEAFTDQVSVLWSAGKARVDAQKQRTHLKR